MKKILLCIAILCLSLTTQAQTVTTHSSCDTNLDGKVNIEDVTNTTNKVLAKAATDKNVVTAEQLNTILNDINTKLDQIAEMQQEIQVLKKGISILLVKEGNKSLEEIEDEMKANGHDYVDLGLSVKWATCNLGAATPTAYGNYYSWGELTTKTTYSWSTYTLCDGSATTLKKYNSSSNLGTVDNTTLLKKTDDVANTTLGGAWRLPTNEEIKELCTKCSWQWTTINSINGYNVTAPNGNSIFLPAGGYKGDSSIGNTGSAGYYWTSNIKSDNCIQAYELYIRSNGTYGSAGSDRYYGHNIRAVLP